MILEQIFRAPHSLPSSVRHFSFSPLSYPHPTHPFTVSLFETYSTYITFPYPKQPLTLHTLTLTSHTMQLKQTHTPHTNHQVLMGRVTVDIKEWVANGRFEGEQRLHNSEGERKDE
jgi:hypothetical protein